MWQCCGGLGPMAACSTGVLRLAPHFCGSAFSGLFACRICVLGGLQMPDNPCEPLRQACPEREHRMPLDPNPLTCSSTPFKQEFVTSAHPPFMSVIASAAATAAPPSTWVCKTNQHHFHTLQVQIRVDRRFACVQRIATVAQLALLAPVGDLNGACRPLLVANTHLFFHYMAPHIRTMHTWVIMQASSHCCLLVLLL